jgi:hypothetical protein
MYNQVKDKEKSGVPTLAKVHELKILIDNLYMKLGEEQDLKCQMLPAKPCICCYCLAKASAGAISPGI